MQLQKTILTEIEDFDPAKIFDCGQCFRFTEASSGEFIGIAYSTPISVKLQEGKAEILTQKGKFDEVFYDYFDLDRNYADIRKALSCDERLIPMLEYGKGIRILRQEPWEALCSFILSQCNNIPRITSIIQTFSMLYGQAIEFEGHLLYTFPTPERVAKLTPTDIGKIRAGYRGDYILSTARQIAEGKLDLNKIVSLPTHAAREELLKLRGVGKKVADCALLFGMGKMDAYPVDVWIRRSCIELCHEHAGIAQQYIFYYTRYKEKNAENVSETI